MKKILFFALLISVNTFSQRSKKSWNNSDDRNKQHLIDVSETLKKTTLFKEFDNQNKAYNPLSKKKSRTSKSSENSIPLVNGINIAWVNFGRDTGLDPFTGSEYHPNLSKFGEIMDFTVDKGGNVVRWWYHTNGSTNPAFVDKKVTKNPEFFHDDVKSILDLAHSKGLKVQICLWSFDMLKEQWGVDASTNKLLLTEDEYTDAYINNALLPLVNAIGNHPGLYAWEIFNEAEGMTSAYAGHWPGFLEKVEMPVIQKFVNKTSGAIRRAQPMVKITNGALGLLTNMEDSSKGFWNAYSDANLINSGNDKDGYLDFYNVHYYSWAGIKGSPFHNKFDANKIDKATVVGEYYPDNLILEGAPTINAQDLGSKLAENNWGGSLVWSWTDRTSTTDRNNIALITASLSNSDDNDGDDDNDDNDGDANNGDNDNDGDANNGDNDNDGDANNDDNDNDGDANNDDNDNDNDDNDNDSDGDEQFTNILEAESADLKQNTVILNNTLASNTAYVEISSSPAKIIFTLNKVPLSGLYKIGINNRSLGGNEQYGEKIQRINSSADNTVINHLFEPSKVWKTDFVNLNLIKGTNTITIDASWGYIDIDNITIEKVSNSNDDTNDNTDDNISIISDGSYHLQSFTTTQNMMVANGTDGNVRMNNQNSENNQKWIFKHLGDNVYTIQNEQTQRYLEVRGALCANQSDVTTWASVAGENIKWKAIDQGNGIYSLKPMHCLSKALDREGGMTNSNAQLWDYTANNNNQKWKLIKVVNSQQNSLSRGANTIILYPNPATNKINLEGVNPGNQIIIYNILGTIVLTHNATTENETIDVSNLGDGWYQVYNEGKEKITFIKK